MAVVSVQSGAVSMTGGSATTAVVSITAVDTDHSVIYFTRRVNQSDPDASMIGAEFTAADEITFYRTSSNDTPVIEWFVVEHDSTVDVQAGSVSNRSNPQTATITAVDVDSSYTIQSHTAQGSSFNSNDQMLVDIQDSTTVAVESDAAVGTPTDWYWQVIDYPGAVVQKDTITSWATTGDDQSITSVDVDATMCVSSWEDGATLDRQDVAVAFVDSSTNLRRERAGTTTIDTHRVFVVEYTDGTDVQLVEPTMTTLTSSDTVTSVDTGRSFILNGSNITASGGYTTASATALGASWCTHTFASSTSVTTERATSASGTTFVGALFVVQHPEMPTIPLTQQPDLPREAVEVVTYGEVAGTRLG